MTVTTSADGSKPIHEEEPFDASFHHVYRTELGYVLSTLRRLGIRPADTEDVAHDVFVAVYRHIGDYDATRPVRPWLFGFAFRIARDHKKLARHRHEVGELATEPAAPGAQPDDALEEERLRRLLLQVLDALDFEKRSIIVMHDVDGLPVPEIAKLLEVPINTAYSRLRLARAAFEKTLAKLGGDDRG